jgi:GT2 family glycosyltransferase
MRFVESAEIGLVIPTYNDYAHLKRTLEVLRTASLDEAVVVVVNDGSNDGTQDLLEKMDDVVALQGDGNLWWSGAINLGAFELISRGTNVIIMWNDDNIAFSPNCLQEMAARVRETDGCVSPVILQKSPMNSMIVRHRGGGVNWPGGGVILRNYGDDFKISHRVDQVPWLPGNALAVGAQRFAALDGVDQARFPQYRGDADFTMRAVKSGAECAVINWCWVENDAGRTGVYPNRRVGPRDFFRGLISIRSSDQLRSTSAFMLRHCPSLPLALWCLAIYYMKYVYWCMKTWRP